MLNSMSVNKDFQTWFLIGWQQSRQPIRSHVRKSMLTYKDFNFDFLSNPGPSFHTRACFITKDFLAETWNFMKTCVCYNFNMICLITTKFCSCINSCAVDAWAQFCGDKITVFKDTIMLFSLKFQKKFGEPVTKHVPGSCFNMNISAW